VLISNASGNVVGGTTPGSRNLISGNVVGVEIAGSDSEVGPQHNVIEGNFVGTDATGLTRLDNAVGVFVNGASGNVIGGPIPGARNVISGNTSYGVFIFGRLATGNTIQGNLLGLAADGRTPFRSAGAFVQLAGVAIEDASNNLIGGAVPGAGNVITGNDQAGVYILGHSGSSKGNVLQRNLIGYGAGGARGAGNAQYGVLLFNAPNNRVDKSRANRNRFKGNGIADVREFTGPETAGNTPTRSAGRRRAPRVTPHTPRGPARLAPGSRKRGH
jgi:titin